MLHNARRYSAGILALFLTCVALAPAHAQSDEQLIRAIDSTWITVFAARDTAKLLTYYAPAAVGMYPNTATVRGAPAIVHAYGDMSKMPAMQMMGRPVSIVVSKGGDLATSTGTYHMSYNSPDGPVVDSGSYVEVLQKINGQWKIVNEIVTSSAPRPAMAVYDTVGTMAMAGGTATSWSPLVVKGFPPGAKLAVIHGDPGGNGDYTIRLQFPDGYQFPVHWHPKAEHLTVLSGTFLVAMGGTVNASAEKTYQPGDFLYIPARHPHFGGAKGVTTIQLHGIGPFAINLGTP
jgi:ketosteroid isomerase-like protein/quercetin dioxygenase-like cupin family protein